ncbi:MAG: hypothetical protein IH623_17895 [Verrucomicrobia bacterium]|nr:hypothetical protein [Verrucomicrobiota bacterium]
MKTMVTLRAVFAAVVVCCMLVLADITLRVNQHKRDSIAQRFAIVDLYTNDTSGVLISDQIKKQPIWGVWNFKDGDSVNCFVEGKPVLVVTSVPEGGSSTEVYLYGKEGKLVSVWKARENGVFYMRTLFGDGVPRSEVWLNDTWHTIEMRTNQGKADAGTILEGKWRRLITTNGFPSVE